MSSIFGKRNSHADTQYSNCTTLTLDQPVVYEDLGSLRLRTNHLVAVRCSAGVKLYPSDSHGQMIYFTPVSTGKSVRHALKKLGLA